MGIRDFGAIAGASVDLILFPDKTRVQTMGKQAQWRPYPMKWRTKTHKDTDNFLVTV
jgi:hypothetical protein